MISQSTKNTVIVAGVIGLAAGIYLMVLKRQKKIMKGYMISDKNDNGLFSIYMVDGTTPNDVVQKLIDTYKDTRGKKIMRTDNYKYMAKIEDVNDINTIKLSGRGLNGKYKLHKTWKWDDDKTGKSLYAITLKDENDNWDGKTKRFDESGWKGRYTTRRPFIIKLN